MSENDLRSMFDLLFHSIDLCRDINAFDFNTLYKLEIPNIPEELNGLVNTGLTLGVLGITHDLKEKVTGPIRLKAFSVMNEIKDELINSKAPKVVTEFVNLNVPQHPRKEKLVEWIIKELVRILEDLELLDYSNDDIFDAFMESADDIIKYN